MSWGKDKASPALVQGGLYYIPATSFMVVKGRISITGIRRMNYICEYNLQCFLKAKPALPGGKLQLIYMYKLLTKKADSADRKIAMALILLVFVFVALILIQDFLRSDLKKSAYYFSESLMFSSFWWFFAPFLFAQYCTLKYKSKKRSWFLAAVIIIPVFLHLLAFPFLVWMLSGAFYYHTYSILQIFRYTLSEYLYLLILIYSVPVILLRSFAKKTMLAVPLAETLSVKKPIRFVNAITLTEGNKKHRIPVAEINFFSASPPYINLHLEGKKYLHNETLKSISAQLDPEHFVRVHKSTIVNIHMVVSYTSRLNGDYDIKLKNNAQLRVSRNFASGFKILFNKIHQFAAK